MSTQGTGGDAPTGPGRQVGGNGERGSSAERAGVKKQINLPWKKATEIAMNALRIRFWRSMITASGIFLSVAFLCYSLIYLFLVHKPNDPALMDAYQQDIYKRYWLLAMSGLVCFVGIMNSMLMSVSERFREIGTMKCLGALDSLIVRLFMIEAFFLGLVSSLVGWVIGVVVAVLARWASLGWSAGVMTIPGELHLKVFLISVLSGAILTCFAALLPSLRAAQMPPAAALRTEV